MAWFLKIVVVHLKMILTNNVFNVHKYFLFEKLKTIARVVFAEFITNLCHAPNQSEVWIYHTSYLET